MSDLKNKSGEQPKCPICGAPAEKGCLYGGDTAPLQWIAGDASWSKNAAAAVGEGEAIGSIGLLSGRHAEGIRCLSCRRIILEYARTA